MTTRTTLLVVEDHPLYRHGLMDVLARSGVADDIRSATSAAAALSILASGDDVDMALCDWRLPDADGLIPARCCAQPPHRRTRADVRN